MKSEAEILAQLDRLNDIMLNEPKDAQTNTSYLVHWYLTMVYLWMLDKEKEAEVALTHALPHLVYLLRAEAILATLKDAAKPAGDADAGAKGRMN